MVYSAEDFHIALCTISNRRSGWVWSTTPRWLHLLFPFSWPSFSFLPTNGRWSIVNCGAQAPTLPPCSLLVGVRDEARRFVALPSFHADPLRAI